MGPKIIIPNIGLTKMKIAFDAKRALNNSTGLGNHSRILLNALMRDFPMHEYLLFSPKARDEFFHELNGNFQLILPIGKLQKTIHPLWRSFGMNTQLRKTRADIFHGLSNEIPLRASNINTKYVVTIHDLIFLKHKEQYPFIDRQIYEAKTRYAAKHADRIIAVSHETKEDLMKFYKVPEKKIEVIYPSVDKRFEKVLDAAEIETIRKKYQLPPKFILNVGSFFPRKNHKTLIEAFDLIKDKVEEDLVLVGGGNLLAEVEELICEKKLEKRVKIISNALNEDLPGIYQASSIFVFPSFYEGFGAPVLEALFSKVPVITTMGGAMEEAGGKNSVYINPVDAEAIASAVISFNKDGQLRQQTIDRGRAFAETLIDKTFAEKTMRVYQELAE